MPFMTSGEGRSADPIDVRSRYADYSEIPSKVEPSIKPHRVLGVEDHVVGIGMSFLTQGSSERATGALDRGYISWAGSTSAM